MRSSPVIVSVLACAVIKSTIAQCGSEGVTKTISSPSDLSEVAACPTYYGNIALSNTLSGNVTLDGIEVLKGDLTCDGANDLRAFDTYGLDVVEGELRFSSCAKLEVLDFRMWLDNATRVTLTDLPALIDFQVVIADIGSFTAERTGLVNVSFSLHEDYPTSNIIFRDNPDLYLVDISGYDCELTGNLTVTGSPQAEVTIWGLGEIGSLELRNIHSLYASSAIYNITAGDLTIENVDTGYSLGDLKAVTGDLQLFNVSASASLSYGHDNLIDLSTLQDVGGRVQVYNDWRHTSVRFIGFDSYSYGLSAGSVDVAGLIHELPDAIDFGESGVRTSYINFRSSNSFFDCCKYQYLVKREHNDFWCTGNVTFSDDNYNNWALGEQRPTGTGDVVDLTKCKASDDSPKYSDEPSSSSGSGGGSSHSSGGSSYSGGGLSRKSKKIVAGVVAPVAAATLGAIILCFRRKKKHTAEAVSANHGAAKETGNNAETPVVDTTKAPTTTAWATQLGYQPSMASSVPTPPVSSVPANSAHTNVAPVPMQERHFVNPNLQEEGGSTKPSCAHYQHCQHS